jgi:2-aminoethylphosphonate transport system permease protein
MTAVLDRPAPAPEAGTPRRAPVRIGPTLWALPPLIIVLVAAVYPLIRVCLESVKLRDGGLGLGTWTSVLGSQAFRSALWRTVAIAPSRWAPTFISLK